MSITAEQRKKIVSDYKTHEKDTGSPEVQIAILTSRINELTHRQLVAMRFASDEEMADLVRDVLNGKLAPSNEIKQRVKNWQADWLRA